MAVARMGLSRWLVRRFAFAAVAVIGPFALPAVAHAATHYAAPNGVTTGSCSTPQTACEIHYAIGTAPQANGDQVIVLPGKYQAGTSSIVASMAISIHGEAGKPMPVIEGSTVISGNDAGLLQLDGGPGTKVSDLKLVQSGSNGPPVALYDSAGGAHIDRVFVVLASGATGVAVLLGNGSVLSDSVAWAQSPSAQEDVALSGFANGQVNARVENVTAWGGDAAIAATNLGSGSVALTVENSTAHGTTYDLAANATMSGTASISADHSNYSLTTGTINNAGQNQASPPKLVAPNAGNFRELKSSPTVDAGIDSRFVGRKDLSGLPRVLGRAPDIGAYELPAPSVATGAGRRAGRSVVLSGTVNPEGLRVTSCRFEYGTTAALGSMVSCARTVGSGKAPVAVSARLTGLAPGTYDYRLVATNTDGTTPGAVRQFVVPAPPEMLSSPHMTGSGRVGTKLVCTHGTWTGRPAFSYAWLRDGRPIDGARSSAHSVTSADAGHAIQCSVSATNAGGSVTALSNAVVGKPHA